VHDVATHLLERARYDRGPNGVNKPAGWSGAADEHIVEILRVSPRSYQVKLVQTCAAAPHEATAKLVVAGEEDCQL
jgi:hypothetical protein